jgi:hypothetical protein
MKRFLEVPAGIFGLDMSRLWLDKLFEAFFAVKSVFRTRFSVSGFR